MTTSGGILEIDSSAALQACQRVRDSDFRHQLLEEQAGGSLSIDYADIALVEPIAWHWLHRSCTGTERYDYYVPLEDIDTYPKVLGKTLFLQEKRWFAETNWSDAIAQAWLVHY